MIVLTVDTSRISEAYFMSDEQVRSMLDYVVKETAARFAVAWEKEAINSLLTSKQIYVRSILVDDDGPARATVRLAGVVPNMVETGASGFDIKDGLLNGPNAKISSTGSRYNVVPFSFGAPGSLEENFNGGILPSEVYDVIKNKPQNVSVKGGGAKTKGLQLEEIPKPFDEKQVKTISSPEAGTFRQYQHKTSIYEGVSRVKDSVTKQNRYQSFRAVSDNSDPDSWMHPGIEARNLSDKAMDNFNVESELGRIIDGFLSNM